MKHIISLICVTALLLTGIFSAGTFSLQASADDAVYDYVKFDFGEGEVPAIAAGQTQLTDAAGRAFYPVSAVNAQTTQVSQENITVNTPNGPQTVSALKVTANSDSRIIPVDQNGKPYVFREETAYTVKVKAWVQACGRWSQMFFGAGNYASDQPGFPSKFTVSNSFQNGAVKESDSRYPKYRQDSSFYNENGGKGRYYTDFDISRSGMQYYEQILRFTTAKNGDSDVFAYKKADGSGTVALDNYLGIFFSAADVSYTENGETKTSPSVIYIDSIEVYSDTCPVRVSYYDGETLLKQEITDEGAELMQAPAKQGYIFNGWYTDPLFLNHYSATTVSGRELTLYARYIDENAKIRVTYMNGEQTLRAQDVAPNSLLWDGSDTEIGVFAGWYTDRDLTTPYASAYCKMEDLTLYGKFTRAADSFLVNNAFTGQVRTGKTWYMDGDTIRTEYANNGWNNMGAVDGKLRMGNNQTWVQNGSYLFNDQQTGELLRLSSGTTYRVTVKYTLPQLQHKNMFLYIGYGMDKADYQDITNKSLLSRNEGKMYTEAATEEQTMTWQFTAADLGSGTIPFVGIYTTCDKCLDGYGGKNMPLSYFEISSISVEKVTYDFLDFSGVSILTDEAAETAGSQAMRVFYTYKQNADGAVTVSGIDYRVVQRGILLKSAENRGTLELSQVGKNGIMGISKIGDDLNSCWSRNEETGETVFSMYVSGLEKEDTRSISFRGYVILEDGSVCYTDTVTYSVADVQAKTDAINSEPDKKERIAIMLVIGQSNSEGAGFAEEMGIVRQSGGKWQLSEEPTAAPYGAVYMSTSGAVTSLSPAFEYSTNYRTKQGGFAPAYAARWYELSGEKVVVLQLGVGSTSLAQWEKDANEQGNYKELKYNSEDRGWNTWDGYYLYKRAVNAFNETYSALSKNYEIATTFYAWNQGESNETNFDSNRYTIYNDKLYAQYYEKMHNDLMADCPQLQYGTIIAVRSCRGVSNSLNKVLSASSTMARRAQYRLSAKRDDLFTVSWLTESCDSYASFANTLPQTPEEWNGANYNLVPSFKGCNYMYSNMHYTQIRYNEMGAEAAENFYKILTSSSTFDGVAVRNANGELLVKFDVNGKGEYLLKNSGRIDTQFLQIRCEDASSTYDFTLRIDVETKTLYIDVYTDGSHPESGDSYVSEYGEINWAALNEQNVNSLNLVCRMH